MAPRKLRPPHTPQKVASPVPRSVRRVERRNRYVARKFPGLGRFEAWTRFLDIATLNSDLYWVGVEADAKIWEELEGTLDRLTERYPRPVAPQRWRRFLRAALRRAAAEAGMSPEEFLRTQVRGAFLMASHHRPGMRSWTSGETAIRLRRWLNTEVTEAILGPDWRRAKATAAREMGWMEGVEMEEAERSALAHEARQEARLELDLLVRAAELSPRQATIIALLRRGYSPEEIAHHLHITANTIGVQRARAIRKLRAVQQLRRAV
jgi:RNA polymerase sigma factor (sigma-70 family)